MINLVLLTYIFNLQTSFTCRSPSFRSIQMAQKNDTSGSLYFKLRQRLHLRLAPRPGTEKQSPGSPSGHAIRCSSCSTTDKNNKQTSYNAVECRSAKFIDWKIAEEHRYTAYNLCLCWILLEWSTKTQLLSSQFFAAVWLSAGRNRICFFRWEWFSGF